MHKNMEMKEMMELEEIKESKKTLSSWLKSEINCGQEHFAQHYECIGELVDMVKDLAEAEEKCSKAKYYEIMSCLLEEELDEEDGPFGYNNRRYSSGQYAPAGKGHISGYNNPNIKGNVRIHDPNMDMNDHFRMGYEYWPDGMRNPSERGKFYDEYKDAKRYYQEMGDEESRKRMNEKMSHNITEVVAQIQEMNRDATPEMQKELKEKVTKAMETVGRML